MPEWKQIPATASEETVSILNVMQSAEVAFPAAVLGVLAGLVLLRRALRPRRKLRRLDQVLPYAHAEPE